MSFRKINKIDYESFHSDILSSDVIKKPEKDQQYDFVFSSILDKHAPVSTKYRKPPTPWMTPEIMKAKTLRHNLERTWRRSRTRLDRSRYKHQCHLCNRMMTKARSKYLADVIAENADNPCRLWNSINNSLHRKPHPALPEFTSVKSFFDHFSRYFVDIRSKFPDKVQNIPQVQKTEIRSKMNAFERWWWNKKTYFDSIVKIVWSWSHSDERVEKLSWYINNSHHWHN